MTHDSPTKLTAAVIGAGAGGMLSILALAASDLYELTAVVDIREDARERIRDQFGGAVATYATYSELLSECPTDVVCVSTYAPSHLEITRAAIDAGHLKGILVEKPLGDTTKAGTEIFDMVSRRQLPMVVPHGLMANSAAREVLQRVRAGDIGDLRLVEIECTGWDIINAGIHWIQYFLALVQPARVDMVLAAGDTSTRTFRDGMQVETEAITMARTASGVRLVLNTGDVVPLSRDDTVCLIRVIGSEGYIEYGAFEDSYSLVTAGSPNQQIHVEPFATSAHQRHLEHLAAQIMSGVADYDIPSTSLQALEVVEAAYGSMRVRGSVVLPLSGPQPDRDQEWSAGDPYLGRNGGRDGRSL